MRFLLPGFCILCFVGGMFSGGAVERHLWEGRALIQNVSINCPARRKDFYVYTYLPGALCEGMTVAPAKGDTVSIIGNVIME